MSQEKSDESRNDNIEEGSLPSFSNMLSYKDVNRWTKRSILKVPPYITRPNSDAYKPRVVSFGPYHHGQDHLKRMEAYKIESLNRFAKRRKTDPEQYLHRLREVIPQLMAYYSFLNEEWLGDEERFLELMLVDGCFLLECFRSDKPAVNDPLKNIFRGTMGSNIRRDMLLIENQLPIQVLHILLENPLEEDRQPVHQELKKLILDFFDCGDVTVPESCLHVLDVYAESRIHQINPTFPWTWSKHSPGPRIPSAVALSNTRVKFKKSKTDGLMDIHFDENSRLLRLPSIVVDEGNETLFLNLMAREQFDVMKRHEVSSYVAFMGLLIRSAQDVKLLRSRKIIIAKLKSDEAVAEWFDELAKNPVNEPDDSLAMVRFELDIWSHSVIATCNGRLANWGFNFMETYCKNIWTAFGLLVGTILSVATVIQTVYAILQFYQNNPFSR